MEKKINIEKTIKAILEQEGQQEGINKIRNILNSISKNNRKKTIRVNTFDFIAYEVYDLMFNNSYSRTRAIDKIADDKNLSSSTVNNHLNKFSKQASEDDYMNFGANVDTRSKFSDIYSNDIIRLLWEATSFGEIFYISEEASKAYYLKYRLDKKKKENRNFIKDKDSKYYYEDDIPF